MKRRSFLVGLSTWPVLFGSALAQKSLSEGPAAPAEAEGLTRDVFLGDFPPRDYGPSLEARAATIQRIVEQVFRDGDGMLRSGANGRTMRPYRSDEVKDRPLGLGTFAENSSVPRRVKTVWMNYENAGQSSGTYLEALCAQARLSGDPRPRELARRTVAAITTLWDNAAGSKQSLGGGGRGWFPKPYAGIRDVTEMYECSADQYCDITLGLHSYHGSLAVAGEKRKIEEIILSFADWWYDHDYSGVYFGQAIWWKRLPWHSMAAGYFLFLNALAQSWRPSQKYEHGFAIWLGLKRALHPTGKPLGVTMYGITLNGLERLRALRPDLSAVWQEAMAAQAPYLAQSLEGTGTTWKNFENIEAFAADYLATADRLLPGQDYGRLSRHCLEACTHREHFYALRRGLPLATMDKRLTGDDYRDAFWCENHVHWLSAYWRSRLAAAHGVR